MTVSGASSKDTQEETEIKPSHRQEGSGRATYRVWGHWPWKEALIHTIYKAHLPSDTMGPERGNQLIHGFQNSLSCKLSSIHFLALQVCPRISLLHVFSEIKSVTLILKLQAKESWRKKICWHSPSVPSQVRAQQLARSHDTKDPPALLQPVSRERMYHCPAVFPGCGHDVKQKN